MKSSIECKKAVELSIKLGKEGNTLHRLLVKNYHEALANEIDEQIDNDVTKVEFNRVGNGQFKVLVNGVYSYHIENGALGMSGYGNNQYVITDPLNNGKIVESGITLQKAKKNIMYWVSKK